MLTVMTHMDADGLISFTLLLKKLGGARIRAYFTSPVQLRDTICHSVNKRTNLGKLYIFDMAGERRAIYAAAIYDHVVWIDHHRWTPEITLPHMEIVIDPEARSAATVVARYLGIETPLVKIAEQIDTNHVEDDEAEMLRNVIGALRWKFYGRELSIKLYHLAEELMGEDLSILRNYSDIVGEYSVWVESLREKVKKETKIFMEKGMRIAIFETTESVPVYIISNDLQEREGSFDLIIVLIHKMVKSQPVTKIEFRTHTDVDVLRIAKFYGGGGHIKASGASVSDIVTIPEILKAIDLLY